MSFKVNLAFAAAFALAASCVSVNAAILDTRDATNPGPGTTYWTPDVSQQTSSPYYRSNGEDWSWQHAAVVVGVNPQLSISAYDVDFGDPDPNLGGERDAIYAAGVFLGYLSGSNNTFSFTTFNLTGTANDAAIAAQLLTGLIVSIVIDSTDTGSWSVSLSKSVITSDGTDPGNPNPGVGTTPLPGALPLFVSGLGAIGAMVYRRKRKTA